MSLIAMFRQLTALYWTNLRVFIDLPPSST